MVKKLHPVNKQIQRLKDNGYKLNNNEKDTIVYTFKEFLRCSEAFSDQYEFV